MKKFAIWIRPSKRTQMDHNSLQENACDGHFEGTGEWMNGCKSYMTWLRGQSRFIWIKGPGKPKAIYSRWHWIVLIRCSRLSLILDFIDWVMPLRNGREHCLERCRAICYQDTAQRPVHETGDAKSYSNYCKASWRRCERCKQNVNFPLTTFAID